MDVSKVNIRQADVEPDVMMRWLKQFAGLTVTQSQVKYAEEDAIFQFMDRSNKKIYEFHLPYSKMYSRVVSQMKHGYENGKCYVKWTRANSSAALNSRFILREFDEDDVSSSHVQIDKWKFSKTALTPLAEMDFHEMVKFIKLFMLEYIIAKGGEKVNDEYLYEIGINSDGLPEYIYKKQDGKMGKRVYSGTKVMDLEDEEKPKIKKTKKEGKEKMSKSLMSAAEKAEAVAKQAIEINKEAAILAAKLEVGNVAVQQIKSKVTFGWFADKKIKNHPFFDIALANVVGVALREFAGGNEKAEMLSEAMIQSAAVNMAQSFNLNDMVNDLLKNVDLSKLKPSKD